MQTALFRKFPLFADLDDRELTAIAAVAKPRRYAKDEVIFYADESGDVFCLIREGQVKVTMISPEGKEIILSLLGPGDFFGEMALLEHRPHSASVRARSSLRVMTFSSELFTRMSGSWAPFKELLAAAMRKRKTSVWSNVPEAQPLLEPKSVGQFVEPLPSDPILPTTTFEDTLKLFTEKRLDFCLVADDAKRLQGVVTRTDLFQAVQRGARRLTPIAKFMHRDPIALTPQDSVGLAIDTMRDHVFKWVPVVEDRTNHVIVGYVRALRLLAHILPHLSNLDAVSTATEAEAPASR